MARKVAALATKSDRIGPAFYELKPQLYKNRATNNQSLSPINAAWHEAMMAACAAHRAIETLRVLLTESAQAKLAPDKCPFLPSSSDDR